MKKAIWTLAPIFALLLSSPCFAEGLNRALLGKKITLNLKDASAKDVFRIYEDLMSVKLEYACGEDRKVTFAFDNVTVETSLNALCESAGLRWKVLDGDPATLRIDCDSPSSAKDLTPVAVHEPEGQHVKHFSYKTDVFLEDAELENFLRTVAKLLDAKLLVDRSVGGQKISLNMQKATVEEILDAACAQADARWSLKEGKERLLTVDPAR
jgi:type II secretory pathway component GspD/PulD (secretin)